MATSLDNTTSLNKHQILPLTCQPINKGRTTFSIKKELKEDGEMGYIGQLLKEDG